MTAPPLHAIVLAAGGATRFGSIKQLTLFEGKPLVCHAIERALELAGSSTLVVLGAAATEVSVVLGSGPFGIVVNDHWREGMASSIRAGVERLPASCAGALLLLGDQPRITRASLRPLAHAWQRQPSRIVASQYLGVSGAPCIFPRWCFADLLALRADQGARALLERHAEQVVCIPHPEAAADVDWPGDLAATPAGTALQASLALTPDEG